MRILTFTTLYPSSVRPTHGIFVEQRLIHLLSLASVEARVVAPVPWFPSTNSIFARYADNARVPLSEFRNGVEVAHPRYPLIPKIGMSTAPLLLASAMIGFVRKIIRDGYDFDLIDAHYFYPDGVAAVMLGKIMKKPVVVTGRGTDLNLIPKYQVPRRLIAWAAREATAIITVCEALKNILVKMGIDNNKVRVLRNGVDLELFRPIERSQARERLGLTRSTLISVGNLIRIKGHHLIIQALKELRDVDLLIVGDGPDLKKLRLLANDLGLNERVRFVGPIPQAELKYYYACADIMVLASSREGWANVLLESMACGTPVVATAVEGTLEVVKKPEAGIIIHDRSPEAIAEGVRQLLEHYPNRREPRRYAEGFGWEETSKGQVKLFKKIMAETRRR